MSSILLINSAIEIIKTYDLQLHFFLKSVIITIKSIVIRPRSAGIFLALRDRGGILAKPKLLRGQDNGI